MLILLGTSTGSFTSELYFLILAYFIGGAENPLPSTMVNFTLLTALAVVYSTVQGAPTNNDASELAKRVAAPVRPSAYTKTVFLDNFALKTLDTTKWTYDLGTSYTGGPAAWGTGEIQTYTKSTNNILITSDSTLRIIPRKETSGAWTSARIETKAASDFACPAGGRLRIQARIKVGATNAAAGTEDGIWPAFWMLGSALRSNYQSWPGVGEIDIMETMNGAAKAYQVVHCGTAPGGVCNEFNGIGGNSKMTRGVWHTIQLDIDRKVTKWTDESLTWSIDGVATLQVKPSSLQNNQTAWNSLAATKKMILLNVAVGGSFPNAIAGSTTPNAKTVGGVNAGMDVDYVVVWST